MKKFSVILLAIIIFAATQREVIGEELRESSDERTLLVLPVMTYSSDTGFGGGAAAIKSYHPDRARVSTVQFFMLYTQKKQSSIQLQLDHYFSESEDRVNVAISYTKFPTFFYGTGNHTSNSDPEKYTPETFDFQFFYEHNFKNHIKIKTRFYLLNQSLVKSEAGGLMNTPLIPWGRGRFDTGSGISLLRDSRDNILATRTGSLIQLEYRGSVYQDEGSAYNTVSFDLRKFISPLPGIVIGSMMWVKDTRGDVPFYEFSSIGGFDRLRGYELERFRDRSLILFQQDFRYPIWGPIGGAVFVATGRVADGVNRLFSGTYHTGVGAGFRFYFNKRDNIVLRFDAARGSDSTGYYLTFGEAF